MLKKALTLVSLTRTPRRLQESAVEYGRLALTKLGFTFYQTDRFFRGNDDRRILETLILPWYASRQEFQTIVFTGCQWYTMGYRQLFPGRRWHFLEIDAVMARRYGGQDCVHGACEEVDHHFPPESLDLVLFNAVFGYGLNTPIQLERALYGFHRCLRPGGEMLFGWDDVPAHAPFDPLTAPGFEKFERILFPPLDRDRVMSCDPWRKTWIFLKKP